MLSKQPGKYDSSWGAVCGFEAAVLIGLVSVSLPTVRRALVANCTYFGRVRLPSVSVR